MQASRLYIACSEAVALRMGAIKAWCVCAAQYCQLTILYSKFTINSPIDTFILPKVFLIPSRQKEAAEHDAEPTAEHGGGGAAEVDATTTPSPAVYDWRQEKINWWWRVVRFAVLHVHQSIPRVVLCQSVQHSTSLSLTTCVLFN